MLIKNTLTVLDARSIAQVSGGNNTNNIFSIEPPSNSTFPPKINVVPVPNGIGVTIPLTANVDINGQLILNAYGDLTRVVGLQIHYPF